LTDDLDFSGREVFKINAGTQFHSAVRGLIDKRSDKGAAGPAVFKPVPAATVHCTSLRIYVKGGIGYPKGRYIRYSNRWPPTACCLHIMPRHPCPTRIGIDQHHVGDPGQCHGITADPAAQIYNAICAYLGEPSRFMPGYLDAGRLLDTDRIDKKVFRVNEFFCRLTPGDGQGNRRRHQIRRPVLA
jgi:hypothetical protein